MLIKSFAKVNINLKVRKRKKHLHKIYSIFTIVEDFYDEIKIEKSKENKNIIICNIKELESDNYIFKVLKILKEEGIVDCFYKISIKKNIPIGSGLGGGSSNAVAVAKYFTKDKKILSKIAKQIGTDCYFFINDYKTAIVKGYGNKIKKSKKETIIRFKDLILTGINCSTKEVYKKFDEIKAWKNKYEPNMLEIPALKIYSELIEYREIGQMSGSGSTFIKKTSLS
ncbi:hypothetical protein [Spiroplasma floricola]|uniref:4-diphosphocytidyl-2-C-methyl-D-erythritol kinase n=1 Tax=Spiroplasma floricola 23-6 TaxID=1336749 RepID=A0A2K8SFG5_9MOLU|nr:hypothetical protein [Spiroplasma floricola]AUB32171.1 4-diphosphocytidyl-2-C-methyl-D-erythritol kinase [Spiroplasma floricola 23-6]